MSGFRNRRKRVARRSERDTFRHVIMPAGYLAGGVGGLGLLAVTMHFSFTDMLLLEIIGVSVGLIALPVVLQLYRLVRGHYSDALDEP